MLSAFIKEEKTNIRPKDGTCDVLPECWEKLIHEDQCFAVSQQLQI
jgi:hypothetical protein